MNMGIIAEDDSDVGVMKELTSKLLTPHAIGYKRFVGDGCGKLRRKCAAWARILVRQGCTWIVVVHDLDTYKEQELRSQLEKAVAPAGAKATVVLIPRREIEAWLLYDANAIAQAFKQPQLPRLPGNPESLQDAKKHLRDLIWREYRKEYLNTIHNALIAKHLDCSRLGRCQSFAPHVDFAKIVVKMISSKKTRVRH